MLESMSRYDRHLPGKNGNDQLIAAAERRLQELEQEHEACAGGAPALRRPAPTSVPRRPRSEQGGT
jgi:hypothetical protein